MKRPLGPGRSRGSRGALSAPSAPSLGLCFLLLPPWETRTCAHSVAPSAAWPLGLQVPWERQQPLQLF